jgi:hypothetical protein
MLGGSMPLSPKERAALIRILGASQEEGVALAPRQRAALDAYVDILSSPPLCQDDVVRAARAMIRVWADVGLSRLERQRKMAIEAELLDIEDDPLRRPPAAESTGTSREKAAIP